MIRILFVDNLVVVRECLTAALCAAKDLHVQSCSTTEEGIEILKTSRGTFDLVLLKQRVDGKTLEHLITTADQNGLKGRVLVMTPGMSPLDQQWMADVGVGGIFSEEKSLDDLTSAIRAVSDGLFSFDESVGINGAPTPGNLSIQERRAAYLVLEGLSNKQVGARMGVSESCVKGMLQRVFLKTGVHSRGQLVRLLMEQNGSPNGRLTAGAAHSRQVGSSGENSQDIGRPDHT